MAVPQLGVWGIDLGQCALKAIRLQNIGGEVTATAFDYIEHPKILSQPDADPDELTREALQQFLSRNTLKGDMVVISVPGQSGLARFVKLPPVEEKKIADIVKFEAKQQIPFPLEEVVWDYQKIGSGEVTDGFALETEIGLFAMKKDMVHRAMQQFKDVNVEVHLIQMAPLALCNYVAYDLLLKDNLPGGTATPNTDKKECVVALDIGTDNSNLVITDGEKIIWQRPIPLGGNHFTRVLTKDMKLTFAKAEHLKRNAVKSPDLKKILASLKSVLNDFVGEVQRSLGYFTNTHRDASILYMVGLGNAFRLPGLQKYLQEKLQLEVRKLGKLERVKGEGLTAPTFSENILSFAVAYGLALQGLELTRLKTNLLPYEVRVERIVRGKKPWAVAAAAALLLAVAGLTFGRSIEKDAVTGDDIKKQLDASKTVRDRVTSLQSQFDAENKKIDESKQAILRIGAGVNERFNWQLLHQYINMSLPRANGEKLTLMSRRRDAVKQQLDTAEAQKAFVMLEQKRFQKGLGITDPKKAAEDEEFIKKHLIQINIEGVTALYSEDLPGTFFKNSYEINSRLKGMAPAEDVLVRAFAGAKDESAATEAKAKLPQKGWAIEVRGYTYHKDADAFVENTIVENLAVPEGVGNKLTKDIESQVKQRMSFLHLLKNETVPNPEPGDFKFIRKSTLKTLLTPGGVGKGGENKGNMADMAKNMMQQKGEGKEEQAKPTRDGWHPIGEVATAAFGDLGAGFAMQQPAMGKMDVEKMKMMAKDIGGKVNAAVPAPPTNRQPRTEFVVLFIWREPLTNEQTETAEPKKE